MASFQIEAVVVAGRNVVQVKLSGRAEIESILSLVHDLDGRPPSLVLVDETELEAGFIGPSDIIKIADAWRRAKNLRASCIAVVAPNVVVFGLNRMFQLVANEEERIMVFRKREDAADWLIHQTEPSPLPPK